MKLLSLLHVRTAYHPSDWAVFDTQQSFEAWTNGAMIMPYNGKMVKMYAQEGEAAYGTLTEWNEQLCQFWACMGFPRAALTLVIQGEMMRDLRYLADEIIQDGPPGGCSQWTAPVSSGLHTSGSGTLWGGYAHQAFAPPQSFDPSSSLQKAQARLDLIADELEIMQTDPAYMHETVRQMKASIAFDEEHGVSEQARWTHIATELMPEVLGRLSVSRLLVQDLQHLV
jgi:hypothetical protein